jgi:H/ACA ribonucleoprotein complex subunit 2
VIRICVLAGNVDPIDVMSHLPVMLEDNEIPYTYVPSKELLGTVAQSKRSISCILITPPKDDADYKDAYDKVYKDCKSNLEEFVSSL